jgi:hypothetical protein
MDGSRSYTARTGDRTEATVSESCGSKPNTQSLGGRQWRNPANSGRQRAGPRLVNDGKRYKECETQQNKPRDSTSFQVRS